LEEKLYKLYGKEVSYSKVKKFIENYRSSVNREEDRHKKILKKIPEGATILDYGCGWGVFSKLMWEKGCKVVGIDQDSNSIEIAKDITEEEEGLSFNVQNIQSLEAGQFDVLVSIGVIEHVHNPGNYLKECNRVLKKEGLLILATPNIFTPFFLYYQISPNMKKNLLRMSKEIHDSYDKVHLHIQGYDPYTLCRLACSLGFYYDYHEFMEGVPFPKGFNVKRPIWIMKNLSYSMLLIFKKKHFVDLDPYA